jgi:acetyl esterase/lipase
MPIFTPCTPTASNLLDAKAILDAMHTDHRTSFASFKLVPLAALLLVATSCGRLQRIAGTRPHGKGHGEHGGTGTTITGKPVTDLVLSFSTPPIQVPNKFAANIQYSNSSATVFDILLAKGDAPAPLVVFIHGGGFRQGDKKGFYQRFPAEAKQLLDHGYGVATISYRFMTDGPNGVMNSLADMRRCIQFIRYHARELHVDPSRIGCLGISAGAGGSIWLAVHDDMADPSSSDPVARESTRISAVAAINPQSSYDIFRWDEIFDAPFHFRPSEDPKMRQEMLTAYAADRFSDLQSQPALIALRKDLDMLGMMDPSDPPMWLYCENPGDAPKKVNATLHHPLHVVALKDAATTHGVSVVADAPGEGLRPAQKESFTEFFEQQLDK